MKGTRQGMAFLKVLIAAAVGVAVAIGAGYFLFERPGPAEQSHTVILSDVQGLRAGSPVTHEGEEVGRVVAIAEVADGAGRWAVDLAIDPPHGELVRGGAAWGGRLERTGIVRRRTEVQLVPATDGPPAGEGSLAGDLNARAREGTREGRDMARRGMENLRQGWQAVSTRLGEKMEEARDWFSSPEAEELRGRIDELRDDIAGFTTARSEEAAAAFQRMTDRGRELAAELRDLGRDDMAEELSESMDTLRAQYNEAMEADEEETE